MRLRLVGYDGPRPPVPGTTPVDPIDPNPDPDPTPDPGDIPAPLVLVLANGSEFKKADYLALGYNRFDVMCIGAAGGRSSAHHVSWLQDTNRNIPEKRFTYRADEWYFGPGGGGGGVMRIKGRLALLPTICPIVVGQAGADAAFVEHNTDYVTWWEHQGDYVPYIRDSFPPFVEGADGGASSFGGVICRASGGEGAKKKPTVVNNDFGGGTTTKLMPQPGEGGAGGRTDPGGASTLGSARWNGTLGAGGSGGRGGYISGDYGLNGGGPGSYTDSIGDFHSGPYPLPDLGTPGGDGAYSASDPNTRGPGGAPGTVAVDYEVHNVGYGGPTRPYAPNGYDVITEYNQAKGMFPGAGGGAKPFLLNGENKQYGSKAPGAEPNGLVVVRLSYAIV